MATDKELSDFLAGVEKRAFKQAVYAVRKDESALDIVQDAMIKLAEKYGDKPSAELPMLFQRILQNTISDFFRREKVRNTWVSLFSSMSTTSDGEDFDVLEIYQNESENDTVESSAEKLERAEVLGIIEEEVEKCQPSMNFEECEDGVKNNNLADLTAIVKEFIFFQAEDGIRDLVRSRGLGDVYERLIH